MTDTVLTKEPDGTRSMQKRDRESSIEVVVFDMKPLLDRIFEQVKNDPDSQFKDIAGFKTYATMGYIPTSKGIYLIDTEGCGPGGYEKPCTDDTKVPIPLYGRFDDGSGSMMPIVEIKVSKEEILELKPRKIVNFGEWVREFGDRLESNFHNWNEHFTPIFDKDHIENIRAKI